MITPLEIQNKIFSRGIRGYKEVEVDEFLDRVIDSYEQVVNENIELKERVRLLNEQLEKYNTIEKTLNETLLVAQSTAQDVAHNANKKAQLIIDQAEEKGRIIIDDANSKVSSIQSEYMSSKKDLQLFMSKFKSLLQTQLEIVEKSMMDM